MNAERTELWNTTQVAKFLGVKPGTVSAYRHRGQMPAPAQTLGARTHLWDAATIRAWHGRRRDSADAKLHELRPVLESGASIMDTVFQHVVPEDGDDAASA